MPVLIETSKARLIFSPELVHLIRDLLLANKINGPFFMVVWPEVCAFHFWFSGAHNESSLWTVICGLVRNCPRVTAGDCLKNRFTDKLGDALEKIFDKRRDQVIKHSKSLCTIELGWGITALEVVCGCVSASGLVRAVVMIWSLRVTSMAWL